MKRLLIGVVGLVVCLLGYLLLDRLALSATENLIAGRLEESVVVDEVDVSISSFPFLLRSIATGRIDRVDIMLDDLAYDSIDVAEVAIEVDGLRFRRRELLTERRFLADSIDEARLVAQVDETAASARSPFPVDIEPGRVVVDAPFGLDVEIEVVLVNREIVIDPPALPPQRIGLPGTDLLPCEPTLAILQDHLELRCTTDQIPELVRQALASERFLDLTG